jgi:sarcosine oxidase subunit alpha
VASATGAPPLPSIGHVTSSYFGARIGRSFALALIQGGRAGYGETIWAWLPDRVVPARICPPVFYDPEGLRRDG